MPSFNDLSLQPSTYSVLASMGITDTTPIQAEAIPALLAGNDLVGQSATGSGKTLAYSIPLVERLAKDKRVAQALVLVPTRELAVQVNTVLSRLASSRRLATALLVGGRPYSNQISALRYGSQIIVGTPGRVKDHLDRGSLVLSQLKICVLDEADQMLDIGFAPIIEEILTTTPETRQMVLFSATMPEGIAKLQKKFLKDPVKVDITVEMSGQSTIEQIAYQVPQDQKIAALCTLLSSTGGESSLIFGKTKFGVEKLGKQLSKLGYAVGTLHGDKSQRAREEVLTAFRHGRVHTLLATNVAARGLDIKGIYQVINYELPESSELFTHRIGRTGRMGQQGKAITLLAPSELPKWRRMARSLGQNVALQRLTINEDAVAPAAPVVSELAVALDEEPRPIRERKQFSFGDEESQRRGRRQFTTSQERDTRFGRSRPEGRQSAPAGFKGRSRENVARELPLRAPEWESEEMALTTEERPYTDRARDGRRGGAGRPSGFGRDEGRSRTRSVVPTEPQSRTATRKPKAHSSVVPTEPQSRTATRKPKAAPAARTKRVAASTRPAGL
jgi:ATP-dependent RNA helicase DeaD